MASSNRILKIYKSRKTILDLLDTYNGYDSADYSNFSINEIDAMYTNTQLDMLIPHSDKIRNVYVKYFISSKQNMKQIRPAYLDEIIEDLYTIENVLTKNDTLIIIIDDEPNETIITKIKYLYDHDGIFIVIHNMQRLQFNITSHSLVPKHIILTETEHGELMKIYHLKDHQSLPEISRFDPVAMAICMKPGQICKILRQSAVALSTKYYRICV